MNIVIKVMVRLANNNSALVADGVQEINYPTLKILPTVYFY